MIVFKIIKDNFSPPKEVTHDEVREKYKLVSQYDVVHTMYHDQGLPVIKYDNFSRTTNVTLGLPITRVSVDHGTATDLVGTGDVDISSFVQALKVARDISKSAS